MFLKKPLPPQNTEVAYILYNDQKPSEDLGDRWVDNSGSKGGHTKGELQSGPAPLHE